MKPPQRELKIIAKYYELNGTPIISPNVTIYLDDEPVGAVQDFKFHVSTDNPVCDIEITFPNLKSKKIAKSYYKLPNLVDTVDRFVEKFRSIFGVKVNLKEIF